MNQWPQTARLATNNLGPQVLLEMSGNPRAIRQGLRAMRSGGTAALLGLPSGPVELDLNEEIIFKGATILGINGRRMFETWYQVEDFLLGGRINLDPILTHQFDLEDFEKAFKTLVKEMKHVMKVLIIQMTLTRQLENA